MKQGDCFWNDSAPRLPAHLWVIISDPELDPENVVIVNLTDATKFSDQTCILRPGDHADLTKPSCVAYGFAKITSVAALKKVQQCGSISLTTPASPEMLDKILKGAQDGDELPNAQRERLREQSLIA